VYSQSFKKQILLLKSNNPLIQHNTEIYMTGYKDTPFIVRKLTHTEVSHGRYDTHLI